MPNKRRGEADAESSSRRKGSKRSGNPSKAETDNRRTSSGGLKMILAVLVGVLALNTVQQMSFYKKFDLGSFVASGTGHYLSSTGSGTSASNIDEVGMTEKRRRYVQREIDYIPLEQLVATSNFSAESCPNGTTFVPSLFLDDTSLPPRKIPRIVHITAKQPCMTKAFYSNMQAWHLEGHSFAFHDDVAVDRLLAKFWPEFPHLQLIRECLVTGAAKADLWRYLVLYEYGGIYSDMDTAPGRLFLGNASIQPEDDAYLVVERGRFLAQYFIATSAKHPIMYTSVLATLLRLFSTDNVLKQYIPFVTGPGALKQGGVMFMNDEKFGYPKAGVHVGMDNRTARVVGDPGTSNAYIVRNAVVRANKRNGFAAMNQTGYGNYANDAPEEDKRRFDQRCLSVLHQVTKNEAYRY